MFTVSAPESPKLNTVIARTLHRAIKIKVAREKIHGFLFVIQDQDGFVVSTLEQRNYLCGFYS